MKMTVQGLISPQTEMIKRIQARPAWQSFVTVIIVSGMTLMILFKLWSIHGRTTLDIPETSVLVHDQRGSGVYLTLKLKCYYCDNEDYGPAWENLMKDKACQDAIMSECYANQTTSDRKTTQVLRLMRSCTHNCACVDDVGWCSPLACSRNVQCCWGNVYCSNQE